MYEDMTYDVILKRMLDRVPGTFDKREGSIIYDALAPAAIELTLVYIQMDMILNESFGDTASREYLIRRASERGIETEPATNAILKGEFTPTNIDMLNARFNLNQLNYVVTELISSGIYKVQCESTGIIGNQSFGDMIPIDYIEGLESAKLTEVLIPGEDEESTDSLRERYFNSFKSQAFGGNKHDYIEKTLALDGVGGVKIYPVWNGGGTVKVVILNSEFQIPSTALVNAVQTALDPVPNNGLGLGIAPIGHVVTVAGVTSSTINIVTEITYQNGWSWTDVKSYAEAAVDAYFKELSQAWDDNDALIARISQIETRFLDLPGIVDIANTTLNGAAQNLTLGANEIPVRGIINA
ncbi:MAG: baseplate J/gp47 family protein [Oscillospiraceae bacterium]|nr:baseplate J/gp47 family protein [Oscillospiraceae bacterium]